MGKGASNQQAVRGKRVSQHSQVVENATTRLSRIEKRSRADSKSTFNNLGHILSVDLLRDCFKGLDGSKAVGTDGVTKEDYEKRLEDNLTSLLRRIRDGSYHPQACRIVEIPKPDGSTRPLAIACTEDKIVQEACRRIVERIYEPHFLGCSYGFRPGRNAHQAIAQLDILMMRGQNTGAVLDIDLSKYFNTIPHEGLMRCLRHRIVDERFLNLLIKLLKTPSLGSDGKITSNEIGSPQGSIISPLLANIYLHYILDLWFRRESHIRAEGKAQMVRYADDVVFTFPSLTMAKEFKILIGQRLGEFGLSINESKTRIILSGPLEAAKTEKQGLKLETFTFLGFVHGWEKSRNKATSKEFWRIKRWTCPARMRRNLKEMKEFIRNHRHDPRLIPKTATRVQGYFNYIAITDNFRAVQKYARLVKGLLFKWLNRRSQRRSLTWESLDNALLKLKFPKAKILVNIFAISKSIMVCR